MSSKFYLLIRILSICNVIGLAVFAMLSSVMYSQNVGVEDQVAFYLAMILGLISTTFKLIHQKRATLMIGLFVDVFLVLFAYGPTSFIDLRAFLMNFLEFEAHVPLLFTIILWVFYFVEFRRFSQ